MWQSARTLETRDDVPDPAHLERSLAQLASTFLALAVVLGLAGWALEGAAVAIAEQTGLARSTMGLLLTSMATSLPELDTSVAAVRRGALTLAVGGIISGNAFDTLFAAASDVAFRSGSVQAELDADILLWINLALRMTGALRVGMIRCEEHRLAGIGVESVAVLALHVLGGLA